MKGLTVASQKTKARLELSPSKETALLASSTVTREQLWGCVSTTGSELGSLLLTVMVQSGSADDGAPRFCLGTRHFHFKIATLHILS